MKYPIPSKVLVIVLAVAAIVVGLFVWNRNRAEAPVPHEDSGQVTAKDPISVAPTTVPVDHDSYLSSVAGAYPQFPQAGADFNKKIADAVMGDIADFTKSASDDYAAHLKMEGDAFKKEFEKGGYYSFGVRTTVVQSNGAYVSVVIREEGFTGGAHGFHTVSTFNYDVKTKKELVLTDFVTLQKASDDARASLTKSLAASSSEEVLDDNTKSMMNDGTDPANPDNWKAFTFTDKDVTLYFGEYQVAPYVFGEQDVVLAR